MHTIFHTAATCFGELSRHIQQAETKISFKHRAIKYVTINIGLHKLWYQCCNILQVLVKTVLIKIRNKNRKPVK